MGNRAVEFEDWVWFGTRPSKNLEAFKGWLDANHERLRREFLEGSWDTDPRVWRMRNGVTVAFGHRREDDDPWRGTAVGVLHGG